MKEVAASAQIRDRLRALNQIFANASLGDFSQNVAIPEEEDELTELFVGVQIMLDVIREKITALEGVNVMLYHQIQEKNKFLDRLQHEKTNVAKAQSKNEAVVSSIGEGMIVIDNKARVVFINEAAQHMLGVRSHDILGQSMVRMIPLRQADGSVIPHKQRPLYQALMSGSTIKSVDTYYYSRADGSAFPVIFTATPVRRADKVIGAIIIFRDVSYEKEVDRAKTEFVSLASHQLRTPLTMVNWYIERLLQGKTGPLTALQRQYLEEIAQGGKRMAALVQSLLNVSRIELGTFVLQPEPTDITRVVQNALGELAPLIQQRDVTVEQNFGRDLPLITTDPDVLHIVLENLINNAAKYTPAGGKIAIRVTLERQKKAGSLPAATSVLICIADTGLGIPRRQQKKIFNKLFRADNVKGLDTDGTGLGLYIVKSMLAYAGGKIWFSSTEGKGTAFYVLLPLTKSMPNRHQKSASMVS